jgi:chemotaxis protein MotB
MTNRTAGAYTLLACLTGTLGCGPSAQEVRLQRVNDELRKDYAQQRQYISDLRLRMQLAEARNRVLIDLVQGLTTDPSRELTLAHSSLAALDDDLERLIASVQHSREDMEALRAQRKALSDELSQAKHAIEGTRAEEAQISARLDAFRAMLGRLSPLVDHGELEVRVARNQLSLQLPESVLFESGQAYITPAGQNVLDRVAEVLRSLELREFQVAGHTDSVPLRPGLSPAQRGGGGRFKNAWQLSAARAIEVMLFLTSRGIPRQRLSAAAHADTQPVAEDTTPQGRAKNRRIEIVLLPNPEELPDLTALNDLLRRPDVSPEAGEPRSTLNPEPPAPAISVTTPPVPAAASTVP